ncbi:hypothetical protein D8S78_23515 [Natrialba swarupiae]|nr:hypothetical protein [Natrialba swarupiae]
MSDVEVVSLDRVLIATADLEASTRQFTELLGLEFGAVVDPPAAPIANRTSRIGVEFVSGDDGSAVQRFLERNGPGCTRCRSKLPTSTRRANHSRRTASTLSTRSNSRVSRGVLPPIFVRGRHGRPHGVRSSPPGRIGRRRVGMDSRRGRLTSVRS